MQAESSSRTAARMLVSPSSGRSGRFPHSRLQLCSYNSPLHFGAGTRLTVTGTVASSCPGGVCWTTRSVSEKGVGCKDRVQSHLGPWSPMPSPPFPEPLQPPLQALRLLLAEGCAQSAGFVRSCHFTVPQNSSCRSVFRGVLF